MSLTSCLNKAGKLLSAESRRAIMERAAALRRAGVEPDDAGTQAIKDHDAELARDEAAANAALKRLEGDSPAPAAPAPKPVRLQNRNRSDAGYVQQMQSIAAQPDYGRLGFSRDFASGAPVVLDVQGTPRHVYGRTDYVTTSKGRRMQVRYAVVEADSLLPSNTADGGTVESYEDGAPGRARVVAGNGRAAGVVASYDRGRAQAYRDGIAEDAALHGIEADALASFRRPVLVREMRPEDVTPDITDATVRSFIDAQPVSEQTALRDARGNPTRQARDRLVSAVFAAAYENDALLALQAQASDPEARTVLAGLVAAAPQMVGLRGMGDLDIRPLVAEAAVVAVNARRRGVKLADMAAQMDLDADPAIVPVLEMFAANLRSAVRIGDRLRAAAGLAQREASKPAEDMFGAVPRRSRDQVFQESFDDTAGPEDLGQPQGAEPDAGDAGRRAAEPAAPRYGAGAAEGRAAEGPRAGRRASESGARQGLTSREPDAYQTDLFGDPLELFGEQLPDAGGRPDAAGRRQASAARPGNVDAAGAVQRPAGEYRTLTKLVTTRQQQLGHVGPVKSLRDAANALAYLGRGAVERMDVLVTDASGKPLAIVGGFKGATSQTPVFPATIIAEAFQVPGAAKLWLVHNHPSGFSELSRADEFVLQQMVELLKGADIRAEGMVAIGKGQWSGVDPRQIPDGGSILPAKGPMVPAQEREFEARETMAGSITAPSQAAQLARSLSDKHGGGPGIVLLDAQNQPIAYVPWRASEAMPLKDNGKLDALYRAVSFANASAALITQGKTGPMSLEAARNLAKGLSLVDVRVLDIVPADGQTVAQTGLPLAAQVLYSSSTDTKAAYEKRIDELFSGAAAAGPRDGVRVLDRSDMLGFLGFGEGPVQLAEGKVKAGQGNHPLMTAEVWKKVPTWLDNPAAVFDSDTGDGLVFIAPDVVDGRTVRLIVEPAAAGGANVHVLVNAYDASQQTPFARWLEDGLARYVHTKELPGVLKRSGRQLPSSAWQNKPGAKRILSERQFDGWRRANNAAFSAPMSPELAASLAKIAVPSTPEAVRDAVRELLGESGSLPEGLGKIVVATSDEIKREWQPLIGAVTLESEQAGDAMGFFDPRSKTIFLIADRIRMGQEASVALHELMHKHGRAVLGDSGWNKLHGAISGWASAAEGSAERRVYDAAAAAVRASRMPGTNEQAYSAEELFPYAVQAAVDMGIKPDLLKPTGTVARWLGEVRRALRDLWAKTVGGGKPMTAQDMVTMAYGIAQRENPAHRGELDQVGAFQREGRRSNVRRMTEQEVEQEIKALMPRVEQAYESGNAALAERLDARLETLMEAMEANLLEMQEDTLDKAFDGFNRRVLKMEGEPGDAEADMVRDLAARWQQITRPGSMEAREYATDAERAATLRDLLSDYAWRHGGLKDGLSDATIIEAAKDAAASVYGIREAQRARMKLQAVPAFSRRTDTQARARELGLPATGTTESINRLVSIAESDPTTWTREDFDLIAPHLSVHQDFRDGAEDRIDSILAEGLRSGMVDGVQAMSTGRNWTYAKELAGKPAYVFISGGLKYQSADNPRLAPGNKPLFAITPEKGQGFYEALQTARVAPGAVPNLSRRTDQTQTPEFKRWFGDSKVVDADGKPLVVYHATDADFDRFAYTEDIGFHFGTAQAANARAEQAQLEDARVLPVYLRARKLLRMPDLATWDSQDVAGTLVDLKVITERQRYDGDAEIVDREQVREWLAAKGYDGIVYRNDTEGGGDSYIVFDPDQIKSAIGNRGTFDPTNADIRFSFAGPLSRTADIRSLAAAEQRLQRGDDAEEVRQDTGWHKAADGKWRYEINDADAKLNMSEFAQEASMSLAELLDHPALFAAYPALRFVPTSVNIDPAERGRGRMAAGGGRITVTAPTRAEALSILLHEVQHGIQTLEGFARGGSGSEFRPSPDTTPQQLLATTAEAKRLYAEQSASRKRQGLPEAPEWLDATDATRAEFMDRAARSLYMRLAGEVEARNTQTRQALGDDARRAIPPGMTADVPDTEVIVRFNGKDAESAPPPQNAGPRQAPLPAVPGRPAPPPPPPQGRLPLAGGQPGPTGAWDMPKGGRLDDLLYKFQDKQVDLKRSMQAIRAEGRAIQERFDAYLQEELYHGRAASRVEDFAENELRPLLQDMRLREVTQERLHQYLLARHAREANELIASRGGMEDGGSGMTTAEATAFLDGLAPAEKKRLEAVAAKVDEMIAKTRQTYVAYGLESQDTVDGWADMFKHYVPLQRESHDGEGMGVGQGFSIKGKESKSRTGSTAAVSDILANVAAQRERAIVRGEKNRVAVATLGLAITNPNPDIWDVKPAPKQRFNEETGQIEVGVPPNWRSQPNVLSAKVRAADGSVVERAVVFNERNERAMRMATALKNLDAQQIEGLLGVTAKITRYFASINTQYNPIFGFTNLARDIQAASVQLVSTPLNGKQAQVLGLTLKYLGEAAAAGFRMDGIKDQALWKEMQREGGTTGYRDLFRTTADRANAIRRELDPYYWHSEGLGRVVTADGMVRWPAKGAQALGSGLFKWLSDFNEALENVTRLAAYKVAVDQGLSKQRAASISKNLTVNFNRKGAETPQLGALYAFFNAAMQGSARIAEVVVKMDQGDIKTLRLTAAGKAIVVGGLMAGVLQALALAAAGIDEDDIPEFVRERNFIFPLPGTDKKYVLIPMPLGWHVLPNLGRKATEMTMRVSRGEKAEVGKTALGMIGTTIDAFNPLGGSGTALQMASPTVLDPVVALVENRDWTGRPIARQSFNQSQPGYSNARETSSDLGTWIAEALNSISGGSDFVAGKLSPTPDQIDYLIGQVTGGVGRELTKAATTARASFTGEDLPPHKIPLVGRFYGEVQSQSNQSSRFYDTLRRMREHKAEIEGLDEARRVDELREYLEDNPEAKLAQDAERVSREVAALRRQRREMVEKGKSRADVKKIETAITRRMEAFNAAVDRAQKSSRPSAKPAAPSNSSQPASSPI